MKTIKPPRTCAVIDTFEEALFRAAEMPTPEIERARRIGLAINQRGGEPDLPDAMLVAGATVVEEFSAYYEARALAWMVYTAMQEAGRCQGD